MQAPGRAATGGRRNQTLFWRMWEKLWWLFFLLFVAGNLWGWRRFGGMAVIRLGMAGFSGLGLAILAYAWRGRRRAEDSGAWPVTEGRVLASQVVKEEQRSNLDGSGFADEYLVSYYPDIEYEYAVRGERFVSNRYLFVRVNFSEKEAHSIVARFPAGAPIRVWYDPGDPTLAVLAPGLTGHEGKYRIPFLVGAGFLAGGLAGLWMLSVWGR